MKALFLADLLLILKLIVDQAATQTCPVWCTCNPDIRSAQCNGGEIKSILQSLSSQVYNLQITAAQNAKYLRPVDFEQGMLQQLSHLSIIQSHIQQVDDNTFSQGLKLEFLNISRNDLTSIAKNAFNNLRNLKILDLSFNRLNKIGEELIPLSELTALYLNENRLTNLSTGSFRNQDKLRLLKLDGNTLSNLHGYVFQGLGNLQELSLRRNNLYVVANDLFSVIRNLQMLDIGQNKLRQLPPAVEFRSVPSLRVLNVDNNDISVLKDGQFSGMHLTTLNLSHNRIQHLATSVFRFMNTRTLDLSFNKISSIEIEVFRSVALEVLILSHNPLGTIQDHVFNGLYRLRILDLSFCMLIQLSDKQFQSLQYLDRLDISHNSLQNIPETTINLFNTMRTLVISNNKWFCDCRLAAFKAWLGNQPDLLTCIGCKESRCHNPVKLAQRFVTSLSEEDIRTCTHISKNKNISTGAIIGISIAAVLFVIIIVIIIIICYRHSKSPNFKILCRKASKDSSHKEDLDNSHRPFQDVDVGSITESDRGFVVRNYFRTMVNNPSIVTRGSPPLSQKDIRNSGSMQSLSSSVCSYPMGMESTV